jgi:hypothetical protein
MFCTCREGDQVNPGRGESTKKMFVVCQMQSSNQKCSFWCGTAGLASKTGPAVDTRGIGKLPGDRTFGVCSRDTDGKLNCKESVHQGKYDIAETRREDDVACSKSTSELANAICPPGSSHVFSKWRNDQQSVPPSNAQSFYQLS